MLLPIVIVNDVEYDVFCQLWDAFFDHLLMRKTYSNYSCNVSSVY